MEEINLMKRMRIEEDVKEVEVKKKKSIELFLDSIANEIKRKKI